MGKKRKLEIIYKSLWDTATLEQRKELGERLSSAYDMVFSKVLDREIIKRRNI